MAYNWIKFLHVLSSVLLFGVGLGTAIYFLLAHRHKNFLLLPIINKIQTYADWSFSLLAGIIQPISGFTLIYLKNLVLPTSWWVFTLGGYGLAAVCWLPAVFLQLKCKEMLTPTNLNAFSSLTEKKYFTYLNWRFALSMIAFLSLAAVFYFMTDNIIFPEK